MRTLFFLSLLLFASRAGAQEQVSDQYDAEGHLVASWQMDGQWAWYTGYYADGSVKERGGYFGGKPHGRWQQYDAQGHLVVQGRFDRGRQDGKWSFRNADGAQVIALRYRAGLLLTGERFDDQGELVERRDLR
ncbi:MAG: hypothetical protein H6595_03580 [Flavobacteriales bacterium]|nr:hypothetical protein [Flavobacteriales bacterium]MCB9166540.1 hypothetical protein [Flavobacteriales bacterium]